jgi:hypothetical protein
MPLISWIYVFQQNRIGKTGTVRHFIKSNNDIVHKDFIIDNIIINI